MDRRKLIKNACGAGLCGCVCAGLMASTAFGEEEDKSKKPPADWRLGFMKSRYTALMEILHEQLGPEEFGSMIQKLGGFCSGSSTMIRDCKGKPEEYFKKMKEGWHEDSNWDKEKGIIQIMGPERTECFCPLIDTKTAPDYVCDCSLGWQKQTFKTVFGREVDVTLEESVLRGGKRCVFKVVLK